jgi:hypothetical protein
VQGLDLNQRPSGYEASVHFVLPTTLFDFDLFWGDCHPPLRPCSPGVKGLVAECLLDAALDQRGRSRQLHFAQLGHDLSGFEADGGSILAHVDGLEHRSHRAHFRRRHQRPDIAVKMPHAALIRRFGIPP